MTRYQLARIILVCACTAAALGSAGCERSQPGPKPISGQGPATTEGTGSTGAADNPAQGR